MFIVASRIVVTGSRKCPEGMRDVVRNALDRMLNKYTRLYLGHGNASKGPDAWAEEWYMEWERKELGCVDPTVRRLTYDADWDRWPRAAGHIRNREMILVHRPKDVLAFLHEESSGTVGCIKEAKKALIPVHLFHSNGRFEMINPELEEEPMF